MFELAIAVSVAAGGASVAQIVFWRIDLRLPILACLGALGLVGMSGLFVGIVSMGQDIGSIIGPFAWNLDVRARAFAYAANTGLPLSLLATTLSIIRTRTSNLSTQKD